MVISRISGNAIRKATVDLRCIELVQAAAPALVATVELEAAMSAMGCSVRSGRFLMREGRRPCRPASLVCLVLVAHEPFDFARGPIEGLLQRLALEVANRHLGLDALVVDLLGDLVRRGRRGDREDLVIVRVRDSGRACPSAAPPRPTP